MFVKLFSQILDSSIADNRKLRHFFTDLLLCADARGFVMMTAPAIARRIGAGLDEVEWGLVELAKPDPLSKTPDHEGRRIEPVDGSGYGWRIINYDHYRSMKDASQMREATLARVRKHRVKTACNNSVTLGNASNAMQKQIAEGEADSREQKQVSATPHPLAGEVASKLRLPWSLTIEQQTVCDWFKRRHSTPWSAKEMAAWRALPADLITDGIASLSRYYTAPPHEAAYKRRDLITLLNNWRGEIDRWRDWRPGQNKPAPKHAAYDSATATAGMTADEIGKF